MKLRITEVNGWSKNIEINKAITRVGSASFADIQLLSDLILPLHLQILSNPDLPTGCRVMNMANPIEVINRGNIQSLAPYMTYDVAYGDEIKLGEYKLVFDLPLSCSFLRTATNLEASLTFTDIMLQPYLPLDGTLTLQNKGNKESCQFQVEINGLPEDCYHIDPIPLLYPGAQENVPIRILHQTTYPAAGILDLLIRISAPDSYPGEEILIKQGVFVVPVFKQTLEIIDDLHNLETSIVEKTTFVSPSVEAQKDISTLGTKTENVELILPVEEDQRIQSIPSERLDSIKPTEEPANVEAIPSNETVSFNEEVSEPPKEKKELWTDKNTPPAALDLDISKVKVVHAQTEEYWGEK